MATKPETMTVTYGSWFNLGRIVAEEERSKKGNKGNQKLIPGVYFKKNLNFVPRA